MFAGLFVFYRHTAFKRLIPDVGSGALEFGAALTRSNLVSSMSPWLRDIGILSIIPVNPPRQQKPHLSQTSVAFPVCSAASATSNNPVSHTAFVLNPPPLTPTTTPHPSTLFPLMFKLEVTDFLSSRRERAVAFKLQQLSNQTETQPDFHRRSERRVIAPECRKPHQ